MDTPEGRGEATRNRAGQGGWEEVVGLGEHARMVCWLIGCRWLMDNVEPGKEEAFWTGITHPGLQELGTAQY